MNDKSAETLAWAMLLLSESLDKVAAKLPVEVIHRNVVGYNQGAWAKPHPKDNLEGIF